MEGQGVANRFEGRCDLVLLGWTAFIVLNLASDYFWTRGSSEAEDVPTVGSMGMGTADIYMGPGPKSSKAAASLWMGLE
ncbi:unnamed protein product [Symbiodinium microadriaticum]|nr:unnamed protein product [Symbiodinium microadriaticum]